MSDSLDTSEADAKPWVKPVQQVVGDEDAPALTAEEKALGAFNTESLHILQESNRLIEGVIGKPAPLGVNTASLQRRVAELEEELSVSDKLLRHREQLLQAIPECPAHGYGCVPHALEWIEEMKLEITVKGMSTADLQAHSAHCHGGLVTFYGTKPCPLCDELDRRRKFGVPQTYGFGPSAMNLPDGEVKP